MTGPTRPGLPTRSVLSSRPGLPPRTVTEQLRPLSGLSLGTLSADANRRALAFELPFTESIANSFGSGTMRFKRHADSTWRPGQPFMPTRPASNPAAYSFLGDLEPGTSYDVEVVVRDVSTGRSVVTGTFATRADPYVPASTLTPTHFVRADGSNANAGTADTSGGAWLTLDYAEANAPSGAVVQVGPGIFTKTPAVSITSSGGRNTPLTWLAQYPILDDNRQRINAGNETWVVPALSTAQGTGAWTSVLIGANSDRQFWKWSAGVTGTATVKRLVWSATQTGDMTVLAPWNPSSDSGGLLGARDSAADLIYTNQSYTYGYWVDATTGDVYLRMPGDVDPNTLWFYGANNAAALTFSAADCRVSGLGIIGFRYAIHAFHVNAARLMTDHVYFNGTGRSHYTSGEAATGVWPHVSGETVVRYCRFQERGLRTVGGGAFDANIVPWLLVKSTIMKADGTTYSTTKIAAELETSGCTGRNSFGATEVSYCDFDGCFNGAAPGGQDASPRYWGANYAIHHCSFVNIADDALEPEEPQVAYMAWDCTFDYCLTALSIAPVHYGPVAMWRCRAWRFGPDGINNSGSWPGGHPQGSGIKYGSTSSPRSTLLMYHNTFWTDSVGQGVGVPGGTDSAGTSTSDEGLLAYNNIIRATYYAYVGPRSSFVEDYNLFATSDATRGLRRNSGSTTYTTNVSAYRTATGNGARTNNPNGGADQPFNAVAWLDALLTDPTSGILTTGSPIDGVNIGGISDNLGRTARIGYVP